MLEILLHLDFAYVVCIAIFFLVVEFRGPSWWSRSGLASIPGPLCLPGAGTTWIFFASGFAVNKLHEYYEEMHRRYGPIMKEEYLGNVPIINLFDKSDIMKVMKSGGKYPLRPPSEAMAMYRKSRPDRYATTGLVNEQGETWHHLRTAFTPILQSPKTISDFLPEAADIAEDFCTLIRQLRTNNQCVQNLEELADRLGFEITCALVLGRRMGFLRSDSEDNSLTKRLAEAIRQHFLATRDTYFGLPFWKFFPTKSYRQLVASEEIIYELAMELINSATDSTKESAVFQAVLRADMDHKEKIATIIDFITAGIHTMKNSLIFLLYLVGEKPEIQERVLNEPSYAKACLTESFRLYPTANTLARILDEDLELSGFPVKSGTVILCHNAIACRNEANFKNASEFQPERWLEDLPSSVLAPFGAGRRICPGKRFIEQVLPIILQSTVRNFQIESSEPMELQFEFLLAPKGPIRMYFKDH